MDIEAHLNKGHSKELTNELVAFIGDSQEKFDLFMPYFLHNEWRICQRAAWALGMVCQANPHLLKKWIPQVLGALKKPKHDAIIRNSVRALQEFESFPEDLEGEIYDQCFQYLIDPQYPTAIQVFSMTICRKIAVKYDELKPELAEVISDLMVNGSAGIVSRGRKELKLLT